MSIVFPPSPTIGDQVSDAQGRAWMWDGFAWVPASLGAGQFMSKLGVTDGSDAPPGEVGEIVSIGLANIALNNGTQSVLNLGTVPPGDWDCVQCFVTVDPGAGALTQFWAYISIAGTTAGGSITISGINWGGSSVNLPVAVGPFSIAQAATVTLTFFVSTTIFPGMLGSGYATFRRVR
jgi:hypothetical protein